MDWKTISNMDVYTDAERDRAQRDNIALNSTPLQPSDLPQEILARLQPHYSNWSMQDNSVNYRELRKSDSVMLFEKQGKDWVSVQSFTGTVVMGETAYAVSRRSLRQTPRGGGSGRGMDAGPATLAADKPEEDLVPTVRITTPKDGDTIKINNKSKLQNEITVHKIGKGETVEKFTQRITQKIDPDAVYNFNDGRVTQNNPPAAGEDLKVLTGKKLKVDGTVSNSQNVVLNWVGGDNNAASIGIGKSSPNSTKSWDTTIPAKPGDYVLTANAGSASHSINVKILDVKNYTLELKDSKDNPIPEAKFNVSFEAGGNESGKLNKNGLHTLKDVPEGKVFITYPDEDEILAKSFAARASKALAAGDENEMYYLLHQSPTMLKKSITEYKTYYNTISGKGLVEDIFLKFSGRPRNAMMGMLAAAQIKTPDNSRYIKWTDKNPDMVITSVPPLKAISKGAKLNFEIGPTRNKETFDEDDYDIEWFAFNDINSVVNEGAVPVAYSELEKILSWNDHRIQGTSNWFGNHVVVCRMVKSSDLNKIPVYYEYRITVATAESFLNPALPQAKKIVEDPDLAVINQTRYIETLEKVAKNSPMNEDVKDEYEDRMENLKEGVERLKEKLNRSTHSHRVPIHTIYRADASQNQFELFIFATKKEESGSEQTWEIVDWTNCAVKQLCGEYSGTGKTAKEALQNAIDNWIENNQYPVGDLKYEVTIKDGNETFTLSAKKEVDGESNIDKVISILGYIALGAAAIALLFAPVPGSRVASVAIWTSILTTTSASVISIAQRYDQGFSNVKDDGLDVLAIAGSFFAAGWMRHAKLSMAGTNVNLKAGQVMLYGQVALDGVEGVVISVDVYNEIQKVKEDPTLSPEQKVDRIIRLLSSAMTAMAMIYVNNRGIKQDIEVLNADPGKLKKLQDPNATHDIKPPEQKLEGHTSEGKHDGKVQNIDAKRINGGDKKTEGQKLANELNYADAPKGYHWAAIDGKPVLRKNAGNFGPKKKYNPQSKEFIDVPPRQSLSSTSTGKKGEIGEQKADEYMSAKGYNKIGGHGNKPQGIDGVYENTKPPPKFVVADAKYDKAGYGTTIDGEKQMSQKWVDDRLVDSVGKDKAREIKLEGYKRVELRYDPVADTVIERDIPW